MGCNRERKHFTTVNRGTSLFTSVPSVLMLLLPSVVITSFFLPTLLSAFPMQQLPALWWGERYPDTTYHMLNKTKQMWKSKEGLFVEVILFWLASLFNKGIRNQKSGEKISLTILDSFLSSFSGTKWWQLMFFLEIRSHLYVTNASYRHSQSHVRTCLAVEVMLVGLQATRLQASDRSLTGL